MKNNRFDLSGTNKVCLDFMSRGDFYSDPVRCFLKHLQRVDQPIRILNLPQNLYTASEELLKTANPIEPAPKLQMPDGAQHSVLMYAVPGQNRPAHLTLEFRGIDVGDASTAAWFIDIMSAGGRMLDAEYAMLSPEVQPNITADLKIRQDKLLVDKMPVMLWVRPSLPVNTGTFSPETWKIQRQWDGALLFLPGSILINKKEEHSQTIEALDPNISRHVEKTLQQLINMPGPLFAAIPEVHERRQVLRWIIHDRDAANENVIGVFRTALEDPDWEVRMTAVLGCSRLKIYQLRNLVRKVQLPQTSREGLDSTDRSILAAVRKAAVKLLDGQLPPGNTSLPNTGESMKAHLMRCVAGLPVNCCDRVFLMVHSLTHPVQPEKPEPGELLKGITKKGNYYRLEKTKIELIWVPAIPAWIGDELADSSIKNPIREFTPGTGFFITKFPITRKLAQKMNLGNYTDGNTQGNSDYLTCSFSEASNVCVKLSQIEDLPFTLPSADEWEMVARGPDGRRYPWGNGFEENMFHTSSPWGAKDMVGIIGQWTSTFDMNNLPIVCGAPDQIRCSMRKTTALDDPSDVGIRLKTDGAH